MLILQAGNVTAGNGTAPDGTAAYEVTVAINNRILWKGEVSGHIRANGGAELLRRIADVWDASVQKVNTTRPSPTAGFPPFGRVTLESIAERAKLRSKRRFNGKKIR